MRISTGDERDQAPPLADVVVPMASYKLNILHGYIWTDSKVQSGQALRDHKVHPRGTVGPFLSSPHLRSTAWVYVILTAGHVVLDLANEMCIADILGEEILLEVSEKSKRTGERTTARKS